MKTVQFKCPSCGAELTFDPTQQDFICDYCGSRISEAEMQRIYAQLEQEVAQQHDNSTQSDPDFSQSTRLYECPNCGAQIITEEETSATFCYYCHAPVVLSGRLSGEYRPAYVIPFTLTKEAVTEQFQKWCRKKWFLPRDFRSKQILENISGIYVPFWLTNCEADTYVSGTATRVRTWREGNYQITETNEYHVERRAFVPFRGIPADGASKIEDNLMHAIEPFRYEEMKPFQMRYLSGFLAQKYDENYNDVFPRIQARIGSSSVQILRQDIRNYTTVNLPIQNTTLKNIHHDYVLLPVWFLHYRYKGKNYDFAINGQSGKQAGTLPISWCKTILSSLVTAILITFFLLGGSLLLS